MPQSALARFMCDTGSQPPLLTVLDDFVASGLVERRYHYVHADADALADRSKAVTVKANSSVGPLSLVLAPPPGNRSRLWQIPIYNMCLRRFGARHRWMGFTDSDEFVLLQPGVPSLPALLDRHSEYGGVALRWKTYGGAPHVLRPPGGVLASYTACVGEQYVYDAQVKSFVQPAYTRRATSVHHFRYKPGYHAVDTKLNRVENLVSKSRSEEGAVIAHYISRSLADLLQKVARGDGDGGRRTLEWFFDIAFQSTDTCEAGVAAGRALAARRLPIAPAQVKDTLGVGDKGHPEQGTAERGATGYGTSGAGTQYAAGQGTGYSEGGAYGTERAYGGEMRATETYTAEAPAGVQQTTTTTVPVAADVQQTATRATGEAAVCGQEYFTKVEDRPVVKERVELIQEHRPVEKEFVVETRATGAERKIPGGEVEHLGTTERIVSVTPPKAPCE
ncbi:cold-regulated 2 [Micractinium conductrix]|uniref:Cold-regulated 2 n=1 Tax=Micractinium conductrix TaxID=554055 RepID=A0A2P6VPH5_9CHLO|nr:cold-regulated 2 [Micractinium conductrix]|eukprot:PSC76003.1 cold-regulated 2 [Micractinium conductrix]